MNCPECKRGGIVMVDALNGGAVPYDFICTLRCGWTCADPERAKAYKATLKPKPKKKAKKAKNFKPDSDVLVMAIRDECERRMEILKAERAKFPPTFTKKGKPNKKFTEAMRVHLHTFAFSAEDIRNEILKGA